MKIRTKLVLLLSTALVVTMTVSTVLRIRWTRARLEEQLSQAAESTAEAIAAELEKSLKSGDDDDVNEELAKAKLRHPVVADIQLIWDDTEEDTVSTYSLPASADEPLVKKAARPAKKLQVRRDEARRAIYDHGGSSRRPGQRFLEPMWRTPDRPDVTRWPPLMSASQGTQRITRFAAGERGRYPVYEVRVPLDPEGPRHGVVTISVSREAVERLLRTEEFTSAGITSGAVVLLMLITTLIIDRVVGRPVSDLEVAMKRVEGGALDERVEPVRSDEIGALSRGFNAMLARLAQADADIRAFNRRLADEVQAATVDLAQKNDALGQLNRLLLEARRELGDKERLAALGQLAAQLAHEIGTPLGSVSGHLQLAMSARELPSPLKDRLQVATRELERVSKIVRDYLDSTRTVKPERITVDVARVVDEAVGIALGVAGRGRVRVEKHVDPAASEVKTDPGLLRQILVNLLTNAADAAAAADGGAAQISVDVRGAEAGVDVSVIDNGSGIAAEDLARIFEPFYTTKGRGKGTGLGLAICRELATALGARISVESAPGRGSTFTIHLPRAEAPEERKAS